MGHACTKVEVKPSGNKFLPKKIHIKSSASTITDRGVKEDMKESALIYKQMTEAWELQKKPNILLSVTGWPLPKDGKKLEPFWRGLMQVVEASADKTMAGTGVWIITGGEDKGIDKKVGEVFYDYGSSSVTVIGFMNEMEVETAPSDMDDHQKTPPDMDDRHTHFVLSKENATLAREKFLKYMKDEYGVLTVLLVLGDEADTTTSPAVLSAVDNRTPVVVVKGPGGSADKPANYNEHKTEEKKQRDNQSKEDETTSKHNNLITIHDMDSKLKSSDISISILHALSKGTCSHQQLEKNMLTLMLKWPHAEEALREFFGKQCLEEDLGVNKYQDMVKIALVENRHKIVEVFIDFGFSFEDFLTKDMLTNLYNARENGSILDEQIRQAQKNEPKPNEVKLTDIDTVIENLMGSDFKFTYADQPSEEKLNRWLKRVTTATTVQTTGLSPSATPKATTAATPERTISSITTTSSATTTTSRSSSPSIKTTDGDTKLKFPAHDLFIWAVLCNYQSMAKMLWDKGKMISASNQDSMGLALVGHSLLRAMAKETDDSHLKRQLKDHAKEFSVLASGVIRVCYDKDKDKARDVLRRVIPHLGDTTCIEIAISTDNRYFIATHACQSLLMSIWRGQLSFETDNNWIKGARLVICAIFPPIVPLVMNFKGKDNGGVQGEKAEQQSKSKKSGENTYLQKYKDFFQAPITVYSYYTLSYLFFLSLYSYILVVQMKFYEATREDYLLFAWVISFIVEEIRQIYLSVKDRRQYWDPWNVFDWFGITIFIIGMSLRQVNNETVYGIARVFLCIDVIVFYARLLQMFLPLRELGPKLLMIGRMFKDLAYFIVILMIFVVSYAVASHSLLYPNSKLSVDTVLNVFRRPYWNIYGELFLETVEGTEECTDGAESTRDRCPTSEGTWAVPILMGFYMLVVNVLLLNLLIAMFSNTFDAVHEETDRHWEFRRYSMIYEYYAKAWLFPPVTLITRFVMILLPDVNDYLHEKFDDTRNDELYRWENVQTMTFLHQQNEKSDKEVKTRLDLLIETVQEDLEQERRAESDGAARDNVKAPAGQSTPVPHKGNRDSDKKIAEMHNKMDALQSSLDKLQTELQVSHKGSSDSDKKVPERQIKMDAFQSSLDKLQTELQSKVNLLNDVARKLDKKVEELDQQQKPRVATDVTMPPTEAIYHVPSKKDDK